MCTVGVVAAGASWVGRVSEWDGWNSPSGTVNELGLSQLRRTHTASRGLRNTAGWGILIPAL